LSDISLSQADSDLTTTLSDYTSTCSLTAASLTFKFEDKDNSQDMTAYSWFTVSGNTFTISPSQAPEGTWIVLVSAYYYITAEAATVSSSHVFQFNLAI